MKTLLFAPMFLDEGDRLERNLKWLEYYKDIKQYLNYDHIYFVDNASKQSNIDIIKKHHPDIEINQCRVHFKRLTNNAYGYWYRAFSKAVKYAMDNNYDKIIHMDTDVFVLNSKICDYVNNYNNGWMAFWCKMHNFPESTFQIINKDQFQNAYNFYSEDFLEFYPYGIAETRLPLTHIEKRFNGDRFGEKQIEQQDNMDYFGQCPVKTKMMFKK